ncbi:serine threonine kinase [Pyrenophora seminiperda CCB06]|uniref:Serine threonine kinase n=1 Tax=Pyrenophora seminiperda CCB06 TaxID=1302712 RepID=A0A3M7M5R9_9PLEO|nr:serine threonine kinase [Pyrenophora seminiperda CCB06]
MREGAELIGEHGYRYLLVKALGQANVWVAVDAATQEKIFIVKQPSDDDVGYGWPLFQHEMIMHELLKGIPTIRQQVDRIPPTSRADPPRIVLEILQSTLWDARRERQFSDVELKGIMSSALSGLRDVHARDLVYADLKMQNILLSGFTSTPSSATMTNPQITAKLGDLGIVMSPAKGLVQPIIYRAPEVYFRNEISSAADIWSWGLIYCQLLEAQASFQKHGIYDDLLLQSSQVQKERSVERAIAHDFGLGALDYYDGCRLPYHDPLGSPAGEGRGGEGNFVLKWVLNPVPTDRPSAEEILNAGWLETEEGEGEREGIAAGLKVRVEESRRRNLMRRDSAPLLSAGVTKGESWRPWETKSTETSVRGVGHDEHVEQQEGHQPVQFQPVQFEQVRRTAAEQSRPSTPRARTQHPVAAGGTFMNYSSFMK